MRLALLQVASRSTEKVLYSLAFKCSTIEEGQDFVDKIQMYCEEDQEEGSNNYYVWKYSYSNGLRSKERIFTKERRLMGTIEYEYD